MANALLSIPVPNQAPISHPSCIKICNSPWIHAPLISIRYSPKPFISLCSSPSSTSVVEDDPSPREANTTRAESATEDADQLLLRGCQACGREELESGCNGEGRIQGGIATVPGFGWWPIKAYRPCPGFLASGGRYRRRGQSMDEVASGRGRRGAPVQTTSEVQSRLQQTKLNYLIDSSHHVKSCSKKMEGPRRFKR